MSLENSLKCKLRGSIGDSGLLIANLLDFVEFVIIHDKFEKAGISINNKNQEDAYIEIIEKDDETLLNDLETYLDLVERIGNYQDQLTYFKYYFKHKEKYKEYLFQTLESFNGICTHLYRKS